MENVTKVDINHQHLSINIKANRNKNIIEETSDSQFSFQSLQNIKN